MRSRVYTPLLASAMLLAHHICLAVGTTGTTSTRPAAAPLTSAPSGLPPEFNYYLGTLGFGGIAGWSVGFTLKKVAKLAAIVLGIAIIAIQALSYHHIIAIDWDKIQMAMPPGSLTTWWDKLWAMLSYNLPFAGGFLTGFLLGFRKG